jgi:hypothetical protein
MADETRDFILNGNKPNGYLPKKKKKKKDNEMNIQETIKRKVVSAKPSKFLNATTIKKNRKNSILSSNS